MPDFQKLLQASLPEALECAIESISFRYLDAKGLLEADVTQLESLNYYAFAYFNRDDVFYVNRAGRSLLTLPRSPLDPSAQKAAPIFWLEESPERQSDDRDVLASCLPKHHVRELVTLSWGKTWLRGSKFPIRSRLGIPLAILFAGREWSAAEQINHIAGQLQKPRQTFGAN